MPCAGAGVKAVSRLCSVQLVSARRLKQHGGAGMRESQSADTLLPGVG